MDKDIDVQFLCKDCARYNLCDYYHRRKKDSYICKYFHYETVTEFADRCRECGAKYGKLLKQEQSGDLISREETLTAFADYIGSGMSMNDYDALSNIVAKMPPVNPIGPILDKIRAEIEQAEIGDYIRDVECFRAGLNRALNIIDKHKAEGNEKE